MEKILRNCLKVLLVMVISISALNLGLVSALEENEDEVVVNYDDQVSGIADISNAGQAKLTFVDSTTGYPLNSIDAGGMFKYVASLTAAQVGLMCPGYTVTAINAVYGQYSTDGLTWSTTSNSSIIGSVSSGVYSTGGSSSGSAAWVGYTEVYLIVTSNFSSIGALAANSYDVSLRNVTGGSLSSTVSKASAGSTVTVTASPSTGYSLSSATVSGINVSLNFFKI